MKNKIYYSLNKLFKLFIILLVQTKFRSIALLSKSSSLDCSINEQSEIKSHPFKELNI